MLKIRVLVILLLPVFLTTALRLPVGYLINDKAADTVAAVGAAAGTTRALAIELQSELEETARNQMTLSVSLEQAAEHAAREARLLQNEADMAKLRAFEAVAQEQAIVNAERSLEAEEEQLMSDTVPQAVHGYVDPLMESSETVRQKRLNHFYQPDTMTSIESDNMDPLEALRVRYLQKLLADRQRSSYLAEILEPTDRLILDSPDTQWQEELRLINRNPAVDYLFEHEHDGAKQLNPKQLITSTIDGLEE